MEDLISRQAAIKMIEEDLPDVVYYKKEDAIECLSSMPACSAAINKRLIELESEKDALIKNYAECMKNYAKFVFEEFDSVVSCDEDFITVSRRTYEAIKKIYTEGTK